MSCHVQLEKRKNVRACGATKGFIFSGMYRYMYVNGSRGLLLGSCGRQVEPAFGGACGWQCVSFHLPYVRTRVTVWALSAPTIILPRTFLEVSERNTG